MLCDRARVIAGSDDQRRCPDASSLRPCRATRTFGLGRRFYGMSDTAVAAKKTVEVGKILIWSLTQFGCPPRWNGRLLSQRPATNVLRASLAPPQAAPAFNMYVRNGNCRSHRFPPSHRLRLLRHALLQISPVIFFRSFRKFCGRLFQFRPFPSAHCLWRSRRVVF
jgi:hypothetical protein